MAALKLKGIINKVVRANGKAEAQMMVIIPVSAAMDIPLGEVLMTIQEVQEALPFGKKGPIRGAKSPADEDDDE